MTADVDLVPLPRTRSGVGTGIVGQPLLQVVGQAGGHVPARVERVKQARQLFFRVALGPLDGMPFLPALAGLGIAAEFDDHRPGPVASLADVAFHRQPPPLNWKYTHQKEGGHVGCAGYLTIV